MCCNHSAGYATFTPMTRVVSNATMQKWMRRVEARNTPLGQTVATVTFSLAWRTVPAPPSVSAPEAPAVLASVR